MKSTSPIRGNWETGDKYPFPLRGTEPHPGYVLIRPNVGFKYDFSLEKSVPGRFWFLVYAPQGGSMAVRLDDKEDHDWDVPATDKGFLQWRMWEPQHMRSNTPVAAGGHSIKLTARRGTPGIAQIQFVAGAMHDSSRREMKFSRPTKVLNTGPVFGREDCIERCLRDDKCKASEFRKGRRNDGRFTGDCVSYYKVGGAVSGKGPDGSTGNTKWMKQA